MIGPNGAGKTTLAHAVVGLRAPTRDACAVRAASLDRSTRSREGTARGVRPAGPVVPEGMSVRDYVLLGRVAHRSLLRGETPPTARSLGEMLDSPRPRGPR